MGDQGATRRLSPRRWRILSYLAQHGSASTLDVALVCAVSRLTAHRDLVWLHEAGLVRRERSPEDRTHTWWYGVTPEGTEVLRRALRASGRPVPLQLGRRPPARRMPCCSCRWWRCRGATRSGASCSSGWRRWRPRRGCGSTTWRSCGPTATAYGCRTDGACGSWYTSTVARSATLSPSTSGRRQGLVDCWPATGVRTGWCRSGRFF
ncbi:DeoR family transcriptional regulator [Micromonospora aurantiaca (nom. illeg.)]|uniref:DeoR family transcriptional regulator n=1 Tax=Micromonospora aurantiaca (nom. illeg.) TaxID=47850 RepID=UPI003799CB6F